MKAIPMMPRSRQRRLVDELRVAVNRTPRSELKDWGLDSGKLLGAVTVRRVKGLAGAFRSLGLKAWNEGVDALVAYHEGNLKAHSTSRGKAAAESAKRIASSSVETVSRVSAALRTSPRETAPTLVVSLLAFMASSGGLDGDGGLPDTDLIMGIDAHRSIFTHSIISGAVVETMLGSTARLISVVHRYFPEDRDPLWDEIAGHKDRFLQAAAEGVSAGTSYHLLVDTLFDPGTYHDLPVSVPFEAHEAIIGANAAAEGLDVTKKKATLGPASQAKTKPSTGAAKPRVTRAPTGSTRRPKEA